MPFYQKPRPLSQAVYESLCEKIPGGVNSPIRSFSKMKQLPLIVERGEGAYIEDIDGNSYLDFVCSWGPLIHGHNHPYINRKVKEQIDKGTSFGMTSKVEEEIAGRVIELVPSIEKVRFVSSGTEATMTALRMARGFTGKNLIIKFSGHYHGHSDSLLIEAGSGLTGLNRSSSSQGIPIHFLQHTLSVPFNDFKALEQVFDQYRGQIGGVILEPIAANMGLVPPLPGFLSFLRRITEDEKALLIFDEVITGFRLGLGGAQEIFGIYPDLTCLGKIIGGGFPAAAVGGRASIMDVLAPVGQVYQAGTLSGNPVAMVAGLASLDLLQEEGFYQKLEEKTHLLTKPIEEMIRKKNLNASIQQIGSLFTLFFGKRKVNSFQDLLEVDLDSFRRLFSFLFERGVLAPPLHCEAWFVSQAHSEEDLLKTKDLILEFLDS